MSSFDLSAIARGAMSDPEFSREMRFFNGSIKIGIDDQETVLEFNDGKLITAEVKRVPDEACKIVVKGTGDHWAKMTERYPVPFFQCLQTTAVKHGLKLSTTNETFAYLPALNRFLQIVREHHQGGAS